MKALFARRNQQGPVGAAHYSATDTASNGSSPAKGRTRKESISSRAESKSSSPGPTSRIASTFGRGSKSSRSRLSEVTSTAFNSSSSHVGVGDVSDHRSEPSEVTSTAFNSSSSHVGVGDVSDHRSEPSDVNRSGSNGEFTRANGSSQDSPEIAKQKIKNKYGSWRRSSAAPINGDISSPSTSSPSTTQDVASTSSRIHSGRTSNFAETSRNRGKLSYKASKDLPDLPATSVKKLNAASASGLVAAAPASEEAPLFVMNANGSSKVANDESVNKESKNVSSTTPNGASTAAVSSPLPPLAKSEAFDQATPRPDRPLSSGHKNDGYLHLNSENPSGTASGTAASSKMIMNSQQPRSAQADLSHIGNRESLVSPQNAQTPAASSGASTMSRAPGAFKNAKSKFGSIARSRDDSILQKPSTGAAAGEKQSEMSRKSPSRKTSYSNQANGVSTSAPPVSASAVLASELNDLAVAHDEGLLGDMEYRLLRQGAFERMMKNGAMDLPQEDAIRGLGVVSTNPDQLLSRQRDTELSASGAPEEQPHAQGKDRASIRSQSTSVFSLFRKSSMLSLGKGSEPRSSHDRHQALHTSSSSSASMRHPASQSSLGHGRRPGNDSGSLFASNSSRVQSQYSSTSTGNPSFSTRSLSALRRSNSRRKKERAEELEEAYRQARSTRSLRGAASQILINTAPSYGEGDISRDALSGRLSTIGLQVSSGTSLLGVDYADKNSSEIKAERSVVEAEYTRLLLNFKAMEQGCMGRYAMLNYEQLRKAWSLSALSQGGSPPVDIEDPDGNFVLIGGGGESEADAKQTGKSSKTGKSTLRKSKSGSLLRLSTNANAAVGADGGALLSPPSSYRQPTSPGSSLRKSASRGSLNHVPSHSPSSPNGRTRFVESSAGGYFNKPGAAAAAADSDTSIDESRAVYANTDEESAQRLVMSLKTELDEIAKRKQDVATKYSARLDFLKSATRSALIREGLKR